MISIERLPVCVQRPGVGCIALPPESRFYLLCVMHFDVSVDTRLCMRVTFVTSHRVLYASHCLLVVCLPFPKFCVADFVHDFCSLQISHGSAVLLGFYLLYSSFRSTPRPNKPAVHPAPPLLLSAISKQQLLFFLAANLLTGTVNMSIQTIYAPPGIALVVLSCYLFTLCLMAIALHWSSANRSS